VGVYDVSHHVFGYLDTVWEKKACIPSASGCRDTFETLSSAVLRRLGEEDPSSSFSLNHHQQQQQQQQQPMQSSSAPAPPVLTSSLPHPPATAEISASLPDDLTALDFLLTNPLPAPANMYDIGSNLPTAELDILPELSDMFGGSDADMDRHNHLWTGMAFPM
jgi:hypothetical protein